MFNLQTVLENLKPGMKLSFENGFLKTYDKDGNSVFDDNEIKDLSEALTKSAASDNDIENLSDKELMEFFDNSFESSFPKSSIPFRGNKYINAWLNSITGKTEKTLKKFNDILDKENITPIQKDLVNILFQNDIKDDPEHLEFFEKYPDIYDDYIIDMYRMSDFSKNNEDYKRILDIIKPIAKLPLVDFTGMTEEQLKRIKPERMERLFGNNSYEILASKEPKSITKILSIDDESFKRAEALYQLEIIPFDKLADLSVRSEASERIIEICRLLPKIKERYPIINEDFFTQLSNVKKEQYEKFITGIKKITAEHPDCILVNNTDAIGSYTEADMILKPSPDSSKEHVFNIFDGYTEKRNININKNDNTAEINLEDFRLNSKAHLLGSFIELNEKGGIGEIAEITGKRQFYDDKGNLLRTETIAKSNLFGLPNISVTDADGKTHPVQSASFNKDDGSRYTEKHFVSPAGIKTDYTYEQMPDGSRLSEYKITNKDGQVIFNKNYNLQQISKDKFISKINDKTYETEFKGTSISVTDKDTRKTHNIDLTGKIKDKTKTNLITNILKILPANQLLNLNGIIKDNTNTDLIMNILKTLPANQLLMLDKIPLNEISFNPDIKNNAMWDPAGKSFEIGHFDKYSTSELETLQNVFAHEFGHFVDMSFNDEKSQFDFAISGNKEFETVFKKEYEEFMRNTDSMQHHAMLHLFETNLIADKYSEIAAEANMLVYAQEPVLGERAMLLQKYFPETIVKAHELFDERITSLLQEK